VKEDVSQEYFTCRNDLKVHTLEYGVVRWGSPETPPQIIKRQKM